MWRCSGGQDPEPLTRAGRAAVRGFKAVDRVAETPDDDDGFADRVLKRTRVAEEPARYPLLYKAVPPTSNRVERLFSVARVVIGMESHSLQPIALESLPFFKLMASYWNVHTVHEYLED